MKKHENAIKALMKNVKDNAKWYGYFEDGNGARYLTNGHLIIKLFNTYSTVTTDFVGDLPRLNDTNFLNKLVDFVEAHKNGDYKIQLHMSNVKMWDKYNDTDNCYKLEYDKNKYIGFNADYMKRLYTLTDDNCITIIDSKSPIYISGVGIECALLPCSLDKNYNADNYALFLEELKTCYIQDEETKKEKAAKKANKAAGIIPTLQPNKNYNGYTMSFYGVDYFILSDAKRITKSVITEFVKAYCKRNNFSDTVLNDMLNSKMQLDNIKARIEKATFILNTNADNSAFTYIDIKTKYAFNGCMYFECDNKLVLIDCLLPTSTETKEETTTPDICADVMSATATDMAATTDTANNDSVTDTKNTRKKLLYGFYGVFGKKSVFVVTNYENKCKPVLYAFIDAGNGCHELKERAKNHQPTLDDFKKRIAPATIEEICTLKENHIRITTNNGNTIINQSLNDFKTIMLDCYSANEGITPTQETSFKFFKGISDINNRTTTQDTSNNAITSETMQSDARQTETTQDKPQKKSISLFIVTDKPQPVKLYGANIPTLERIPTYTQHIISRLQPLKSHRVYNNRVKELKPLKKAYNDFVGTVSCYNDKCAMGGDMVAVNSS